MSGPPSSGPLIRIASQWLLGALLALALSGLFLAVNALQLSSRGTSQRLLNRAVAVITDVDALLPQLQQDLKETAASAEGDTVRVPGFPIAVELPREEAARIDPLELRQRLLIESAQQTYEGGMKVFAATDPDAQREIELISTVGAIDRGLGAITEDNHTRIRIAAVVLGFISALLALLLMAAVRSYGRLVAAGAVILAAALPSLAAAVAVRFVFRSAQEEADPFINRLLDLGVVAMRVPIRNYIILAALGGALLALGSGLAWAADRGRPAG